ncbi:hypothetical protein FE634_00710 [Nocardioides dongxiaopingii]|uniref:hypothetical protein n=1 Tax=Nocardioides sp. S-1144 TaxID=2582905 RepID=UPI00110EA8D9|nr:hypothetical protein [Nocardioides sp. S-1144]QCW49300.1 hypothetical protein FE634_00710 [Nocardioides sp. S-1144]
MSPDDVRELAREAHARWTTLEIVHRSPDEELHAWLRHGELDAVRLPRGERIRERGAPPSSFQLRDVEPYPTNYQWSAMLDPYELSSGVTISDVRPGELSGRPTVAFTARAEEGYDPICACCPLVFSEVSERLERGDSWRARPGEVPDHVEVALDLEIGIVVSSRDHGGRLADWFTNEIVSAT